MIIGIGILLVMWCLCLIAPLVLVSKWRSRPVMALFSAAILCGLSYAFLFALMDMALNSFTGITLSIALILGLIALVLALPVLAIVQAVKRQKQPALTSKEIADTF